MLSNGRDDLDTGEISISLNGETLILHPTIKATRLISNQCQGLAKARQAIVDEDFDKIVFIIRVGTNMTDKDAKSLEHKVWSNGLDLDLLVPLIEYVAILNNGGRPRPKEMDGSFEVVSSNQIEDHSGNG